MRGGLCVVINALLFQSLTSTRATLPVRYTSSIIESSSLPSCLLFNRARCHRFSRGAYPAFSFSSNKLLCARWLRQPRLPKWVWQFWGQGEYSSELLPAEDVMIKVCATADFYTNPKCPWPSLCMALSLSLVGPITRANEKTTIVALCQWFPK